MSSKKSQNALLKERAPRSMRNFIIPVVVVVSVSFSLGIIWGLKLRHDREVASGMAKPAHVLRVLTFKNLLRSELISGFESRASTKIELTEVGTDPTLAAKSQGASPGC